MGRSYRGRWKVAGETGDLSRLEPVLWHALPHVGTSDRLTYLVNGIPP